MKDPPAPLLLVEDEPDDVLLFQLALASVSGDIPLRVARDGEEALEYLEGRGRYAGPDVPVPRLVVLDLKLPRRSGLDVLARIRELPRLRALPVIVLSSSQELADVAQAGALGVEEYFVKPADFPQLQDIVRRIGQRWASLAPSEAEA